MLRFLSRQQIVDTQWDRCVSKAHNALLYGHSWYLDAVTNIPRSANEGSHPAWRWEGLVQLADDGTGYVAVLPVPLRHRWGRWVVYQPFFSQFLAVFSRQPIDPTPFLIALVARYRYASFLSLHLPTLLPIVPDDVQQQICYTHTLLVKDAATRYTSDRRMNLRRAYRRTAQTPGWRVSDSTDVQPLLALFRQHHANQIGVGEWSYALFEQVFETLQQRGLGTTLRYAYVGDVVVAGVFFAEQHGRIIYLFNAAAPEGRRLNARTLLLHEHLQNAAAQPESAGLLFDFESPEKPEIVRFYESFGAEPTPYLQLSWNRLTTPERWLQQLTRRWPRRTV